MYFLRVFLGQESGHSLAESSASGSFKVAIEVLAKFLDWGGISFLTHSGRIQFLSVFQTEDLSFLLALSWSLLSAPCHMLFSTWQLTTWQLASSSPAKERVS